MKGKSETIFKCQNKCKADIMCHLMLIYAWPQLEEEQSAVDVWEMIRREMTTNQEVLHPLSYWQ